MSEAAAGRTRIYVVASDGKPFRLVDATSAAQALRHVAKDAYQVTVAKTRDVAFLMAKGVTVEDAREPEPEAEKEPA